MMDINKLIMAESLAPCEADAYLSDLENWNEEIARTRAEAEGIELTEAHLDVICSLREQFAVCGPTQHARIMLRNLEDEYRDQGGRKYLFSLFPHGPITQGCRLAGLPTPADNTDPAFGTVH